MATEVLTVYIGGVDKTAVTSDVRYEGRVNGIGTAHLTVFDESAPYVPDDDDEVLIYLDGVLKWSGQISALSATYLGPTDGILCEVDCQDRNQLAQRAIVNAVLPSESLKARLQRLLADDDLFGGFGVTLDPAQATGPTLDEVSANWWTIETLLNHATSLTGWLWRIDENKVLSMWPLGSRVCAQAIDEAVDGSVLEASWQRTRFDYRNQQWVVYGPDGANQVYVEDPAEVAARGPWRRADKDEGILLAATATAWATALIRQNLPQPLVPSVKTLVQGIGPGETIDVALSAIGFDDTCLVQSVAVQFEVTEDDKVIRISTIGLIGGDELTATSAELWRRMVTGLGLSAGLGVGAGGGIISVGTGRRYASLGGSRTRTVAPAGWVAVPEARGVVLYVADFPLGTATVHVWQATRDAGTTVQTRLAYWDGAAWLPTGGISIAGTETDIDSAGAHESFDAPVVDGKIHRLEIARGGASAAEVSAQGYVE